MFIPTWIIMLTFLAAFTVSRLEMWLTNPDLPIASRQWWQLAICILAMLATIGLNGRTGPLVSEALLALALGMLTLAALKYRRVLKRQGFKKRN